MAESKNWVLLRGLARGQGHWGTFPQRMKERFPLDKIELLDLPGNGTRNSEISPLAIVDYVSELRKHCSFSKRAEPFRILSLSLGSMVAVEWMRQFPHEIEKTFLVCTSSKGHSPFYHRFQWANYLKAMSLFGAETEQWEKTILEMVTNNHERRAEELPFLVKHSEKFPVKPMNILRQMKAASQYQFPKEAPGPIHLMGSYGDNLVSPQCTLRIAERWGLEAVMHPWAGHDIPIDDPLWLLEHLL